jgi:hypothetical protein
MTLLADLLLAHVSLLQCDIIIGSFDAAQLPDARACVLAALRLNGRLEKFSLQIGDTTLTLSDVFPLGDRISMRAALDMPLPVIPKAPVAVASTPAKGAKAAAAPAAAAPVAGGFSETKYFLPLTSFNNRSAWQSWGTAHFGTVFSAVGKDSGGKDRPVLVKAFQVDKITKRHQSLVRMQVNEFSLLFNMPADTLARLQKLCIFPIGFSLDATEMLVFSPLMHGSLEVLGQLADVKGRLDVLNGAADALSTLHMTGFLHRDIAARSVMWEKEMPPEEPKTVAKTPAPKKGASKPSGTIPAAALPVSPTDDSKKARPPSAADEQKKPAEEKKWTEYIVRLGEFGLACPKDCPWQPEEAPLDSWPPEHMVQPFDESGDVWSFGLMMAAAFQLDKRPVAPIDHAWLRLQFRQPAIDSAACIAALLEAERFHLLPPVVVPDVQAPSGPPTPKTPKVPAASSEGTATVQTEAPPTADAPPLAADAPPPAVAAAAAAAATEPPPPPVAAAPAKPAASAPKSVAAAKKEYYLPPVAGVAVYQKSKSMPVVPPLRTAADLAKEAGWLDRITVTSEDMEGAHQGLKILIPFLIHWCTRVEPRERPSIHMVHLLIRAVLRDTLCDLPRAICMDHLCLHFSPADAFVVAAIMRISNTPLDLSKTRFNGRVSEGGWQILVELLKLSLTKCSSLDLEDNDLSNASAALVVDAIVVSDTLSC